MVKYIIFILFLALFSHASTLPQDVATKNDIRVVIEQMDNKIEEVDKRLDFLQNLLYVIIVLIFASLFIAIYLRDKKDAESKRDFDLLKSTIFVLRGMAEDDEKMAKKMRAAGIM